MNDILATMRHWGDHHVSSAWAELSRLEGAPAAVLHTLGSKEQRVAAYAAGLQTAASLTPTTEELELGATVNKSTLRTLRNIMFGAAGYTAIILFFAPGAGLVVAASAFLAFLIGAHFLNSARNTFEADLRARFDRRFATIAAVRHLAGSDETETGARLRAWKPLSPKNVYDRPEDKVAEFMAAAGFN